MSWRMVKAVLDHPAPAAAGARLLLVALADRADDRGLCWPSVRDLAARTCLTERHVTRLLGKLCKPPGALRIVRPGGGRLRSGVGATNRYLLRAGRTDAELAAVEATLTPASGLPAPNPDAGAPEPGHPGAPTLTPARTYPDTGVRGTIREPAAEQPRERKAGGERIESAAAEKKEGPTNGRSPPIARPPATQPAPADPQAALSAFEKRRAELIAVNPMYEERHFLAQRLMRDAGGFDESFINETAGCSPQRIFDALAKMGNSNVRSRGGWMRRELGLMSDMPRYK